MTHAHPLPTPDHVVIQIPISHLTISYETWVFAILFVWSIIGIALYLYGHGLKEGKKPAFTFICGPSAWVAASWKVFCLAKVRARPPAIPKNNPPILKHWEMPNQRL